MIDSIVIDASHPASLARFWCEVLDDYEIAPYTDEDMADLKARGIDDVEDDPSVMCLPTSGAGPRLFCQKVPEARTAKSRTHLDVRLRDRAHFERLLELGASVVREWDAGDGAWMLDPQGNDFCVFFAQ